MAFGTVAGSKVQCGSALAVAHTPNWKAAGVGWNPRAWSGLNPSWPVSITVKRQPRTRRPAQRRLRTRERDVARDRVSADRDGAHRGRRSRIDEALAEALDLEQPAPGAPRSDGSCVLGNDAECRRRRRTGLVHVDVNELGAEWAAEGRRQVAGLDPERNRAAGVVDLEIGQVVRAGVEVRRRRVDVVARAVVVAGQDRAVEEQRAWTTSLTTVRTTWAVPPFGAVLVTTRTLLPTSGAMSKLNEPSAAALPLAWVVVLVPTSATSTVAPGTAVPAT